MGPRGSLDRSRPRSEPERTQHGLGFNYQKVLAGKTSNRTSSSSRGIPWSCVVFPHTAYSSRVRFATAACRANDDERRPPRPARGRRGHDDTDC